VCGVDVLAQILVSGPEAPVDVNDDHIRAVILQPCLIELAAKDVPLVIKAGLWVRYNLIGGACKGIADHGWRRSAGRRCGDGDRHCHRDLGNLPEPIRSRQHVGVIGNPDCEEIP
jgi:hypothetical protein